MTAQSRTITSSENHAPREAHERLSTLVHSLAADPHLHHASLAVSDAEGRHWSGASGPRDAEPEVRPDTPFMIASITKRFIVTLLLQAHERGELHLDDPVSAHLPAGILTGLHVRQGTDRMPQVSIRHLASHTSGLPDFFERRSGGPSFYHQLRIGQDVGWDFDDVIDITRNQQHPHFEPQDLDAPRQRARYSDTGFQLLVRILERATEREFPALLAERISAPLGLTSTWHTALDPALQPTKRLPICRGAQVENVSALVRSSNDLISTTSDLLTLERAIVSGRVFRDPSTRLLLTERSNRLRNAPAIRYGLGTMTFTVNRVISPLPRPVTLVGHSGSTGTWLFTCPELGVHLAGTIDQTQSRQRPFRIMAKCLRIWQQAREHRET